MSYAVEDHRTAELNVDGATAGRYTRTLEEMEGELEQILDRDQPNPQTPMYVWVSDQTGEHCHSADEMAHRLKLEAKESGLDASPQRRDKMVERLATIISETTAARGVDLFATDVCDLDAAEWARMTNRDASTVQRNVRRARR